MTYDKTREIQTKKTMTIMVNFISLYKFKLNSNKVNLVKINMQRERVEKNRDIDECNDSHGYEFKYLCDAIVDKEIE